MCKCNCGREFKTTRSLNSHARFCKLYKKSKKESMYKISGMYICECGKEFEKHQSLNSHFRTCLIHRKGIPAKGKNVGWNLSPEQHRAIGKTLSENIANGKTIPAFKGKQHSVETKSRMSRSAARNSSALNGYVKTKFYDVYCIFLEREIKVQGTWELKYAEYLNENSILWTRGKFLSYKNEGIVHTYRPDFYLIETDEYVEIKGYMWKNDETKMKLVKEQNPDTKILILMKDELSSLGIL